MWERKNRSRDLSNRPTGAIAATAIAVALPVSAVVAFAHRSFGELYVLHFVTVTATTIVATAAALLLTAFGARRDDRRAVVVGIAFSAMAGLLLVHGLATPEILAPEENGLIAFAGGATLPVGAAVLCLVGSPTLRGPGAVRRLLWLQGALIAAILAVGAIGLTVPSIVPAEPSPKSPPALALLGVSVVLFGLLASRARRTYVLTRRPADLWVLIGIGWLTTRCWRRF